jgi:hypothetical protein
VPVERDRHRADITLASAFDGSLKDGTVPKMNPVEEPHGDHAGFLVEGKRSETCDGPHGR